MTPLTPPPGVLATVARRTHPGSVPVILFHVCGRYSVGLPVERLKDATGCDVGGDLELPVYNAGPGRHLPVVLDSRPGRVVPAFWGFPRGFGRRAGRMLINARSETVHQRPMFRESFRSRRCLVIADGFYEWAATREGKLPFRLTPANGGLFTFAGIWMDMAGAPAYVILTTVANGVTRPIHDRMPVILEAGERDVWLDADLPIVEACRMLDPYPDAGMRACRVTRAVNDARNEGPDLVVPLGETRSWK